MRVFFSTNYILPQSNEYELIIIKILDDAFLSKYPRALKEIKTPSICTLLLVENKINRQKLFKEFLHNSQYQNHKNISDSLPRSLTKHVICH